METPEEIIRAMRAHLDGNPPDHIDEDCWCMGLVFLPLALVEQLMVVAASTLDKPADDLLH